MLTGSNVAALGELARSFPGIGFIASGGVSCIEDVKNLLDLKLDNLVGVITGKAIYENRLSVTEAVKLTQYGYTM